MVYLYLEEWNPRVWDMSEGYIPTYPTSSRPKMNKFAVTTLESQFHMFDARTQHPKKGFTSMGEKVPHSSTVWGTKHLPQNRDIAM
eukprot:3728499-Pyramimonas_sp.AAC.1